MLSWLLSLIPGLFTTINGITNAISNEKIAALNAKTDQERIQSDTVIAQLEAQRAVIIAEAAQSKLNIYIRSLIAIGPATYLTKIFLWDKVLQVYTHGSTDPIDANLWQVIMVVLGFYFLSEGAISVARVFKS